MTKKITKLEKETATWKQRWEKSHQALLEMAADRQHRDGEFALTNRQLAQLQKLCRTLQTERTSLLAKLKISGIQICKFKKKKILIYIQYIIIVNFRLRKYR